MKRKQLAVMLGCLVAAQVIPGGVGVALAQEAQPGDPAPAGEADPEAADSPAFLAYLAGLGPARRALVLEMVGGPPSGTFRLADLPDVLLSLDPAPHEAFLARVEAMTPAARADLRDDLTALRPPLMAEFIEDLGTSPEVRAANAERRVKAELPDEERAGFAALLARMTPGQRAAFLDVTRPMHGIGLRGLFADFLTRLDPAQQGAMLALIERMTQEERRAYANALHFNPHEKWAAVPEFLVQNGAFDTLRVMFGFFPCAPVGAAGLQKCYQPAGAVDFLGKWRQAYVSVASPLVRTGESTPADPRLAAPAPARAGQALPPVLANVNPDFAAFMATVPEPRRWGVLQVRDQLGSDDLRGRFEMLLMGLNRVQSEAMIDLSEKLNEEVLAEELRHVAPEKWPALPRFLGRASFQSVAATLQGHIPCRQYREDGLFSCTPAEGTAEFFNEWPIRETSRVFTYVKAHGVMALRDRAPWQAQIYKAGHDARPYTPTEKKYELDRYGRNLSDFERWHVCGGVYFKPGWILTAAHCTKPPEGSTRVEDFLTNRKVRLGTLDIGQGGGTVWRVDGVVRHSAADPAHPEKGYDIALLHITLDRTAPGPVDPNKVFPPRTARLADSRLPPLENGEDVELTGWGVTRVAERTHQDRAANNEAQVSARMLQVANLQYWGASNCNHDRRFVARRYLVKPGQICAGSTGDHSACLGDSGGPLIWRRPRIAGQTAPAGPVLIGLVSYGVGCGNRNAPSAFVDVRAFETWIAEAQKKYRPGKFIFVP